MSQQKHESLVSVFLSARYVHDLLKFDSSLDLHVSIFSARFVFIFSKKQGENLYTRDRFDFSR